MCECATEDQVTMASAITEVRQQVMAGERAVGRLSQKHAEWFKERKMSMCESNTIVVVGGDPGSEGITAGDGGTAI